jgi:hypothetical protein
MSTSVAQPMRLEDGVEEQRQAPAVQIAGSPRTNFVFYGLVGFVGLSQLAWMGFLAYAALYFLP